VAAETIIGIVFGGLGLALLGGAAWLVARTQRHVRTALRVPGRVVGHARIRTERNRPHESPAFAPIVEYELDGRPQTYRSGTGAGTPRHAVGEIVEVLVQPGDPASAMLPTFAEQWLLPLLMAGFGVVCVAIALLVASAAP
jgi:Protein of unknown function (DUF3592)